MFCPYQFINALTIIIAHFPTLSLQYVCFLAIFKHCMYKKNIAAPLKEARIISISSSKLYSHIMTLSLLLLQRTGLQFSVFVLQAATVCENGYQFPHIPQHIKLEVIINSNTYFLVSIGSTVNVIALPFFILFDIIF